MKTAPCFKCKERFFRCHCDCQKHDEWVNEQWKIKAEIREQKNCEIFKYLHGRRATQ